MLRILRFIPACAGNTLFAALLLRFETVHPRVCGEHLRFNNSHISSPGSSPRVRGTQQQRGKQRPSVRFIPACAGNTSDRGCCCRYDAVHPRVCGEHELRWGYRSEKGGSSPRVRGTHAPHFRRHHENRFIPACAGNTPVLPRTEQFGAVHPRVCGEHDFVGFEIIDAAGSSPRVRGTLARRTFVTIRPRFIPACAGNTLIAPKPPDFGTVHPRVCGEHVGSPSPTQRRIGSSPRVRGTRPLYPLTLGPIRFIPACAGNTRYLRGRNSPRTVHPRVCGEHCRPTVLMISRYGSSPRVRGTLLQRLVQYISRRFIPACAGNTYGYSRPFGLPSVHPRVCGEHRAATAAARYATGSSPRVRGTREMGGVTTTKDRFIPACAGNTMPTH